MPKKVKKNKTNNLKVGFIFGSIIVILIFFSLLGKMIFVLKEGKYDSNYPFYLEVDSSSGVQVLSVFPKQHKISLLNIEKNKETTFPVLADAKIWQSPTRVNSSNISSFLISPLKNGNIKTDLTVVDMIRLYLFAKTVGASDVNVQDLKVSLDAASADKVIYSLFSDSTIISEGLRVEIVNATGMYGVGNKVARILSDMGVNVVFVSTADDVEKQSLIYYTDKNYTVERLTRLLGSKAVENMGKSISDIKIQIGQDSLEKIK